LGGNAMKIKGMSQIIRTLNARHMELAKIRDKLSDDVMEFETLLDDCKTAMDDIQSAIATLSEQQ
jgi:hypothetical protein